MSIRFTRTFSRLCFIIFAFLWLVYWPLFFPPFYMVCAVFFASSYRCELEKWNNEDTMPVVVDVCVCVGARTRTKHQQCAHTLARLEICAENHLRYILGRINERQMTLSFTQFYFPRNLSGSARRFLSWRKIERSKHRLWINIFYCDLSK